MNKLRSIIPGFRSKKKKNMVLALVYYVAAIYGLITEKDFGVFIFMMALPFLMIGIFDLVKVIFRKENIKVPLLTIILTLVVALVGVGIAGTTEAYDVGKEDKKPTIGSKDEPISEPEKGPKEEKKDIDDILARESEEEIKDDEETLAKDLEQKHNKGEESKDAITRNLQVHFINVGQGDSTLIELPNGENALIDGGTRSSGSKVSNYIKQINISKIDYLIATHPHEDHIGGLIQVINDHNIGKVFMPDKIHTTVVFEDLLKAIQNKGVKITTVSSGDSILNKDGINMNVLAPSSVSGNNLNHYSIVNKLTFGSTSFLFTGDAEAQTEGSLVRGGADIQADVLGVPHHGGNTSSSNTFLSRVNPKYSIISCGKDNSYGHPHDEVIKRLNNTGSAIYRTDIDGTIIAISDGKNITFNKKANDVVASKPKDEPKPDPKPEPKPEVKPDPKPVPQPEANPDPIGAKYLANANTKKFHYSTCTHAKKIAKHNRVEYGTRKEAIDNGYVPCKVCKP